MLDRKKLDKVLLAIWLTDFCESRGLLDIPMTDVIKLFFEGLDGEEPVFGGVEWDSHEGILCRRAMDDAARLAEKHHTLLVNYLDRRHGRTSGHERAKARALLAQRRGLFPY